MQLYTNSAEGTLSAGIGPGDTSIVLTAGHGARFPDASGAENYFHATLITASNTREIIKVTNRATDTLTVVRGQDGTTPLTLIAGERIALRWNRVMLQAHMQESSQRTATSGTDTYTATLAPAPKTYNTGQVYIIDFVNPNTLGNPTLNLNSFGAKTIKLAGGYSLQAGHLNGCHHLYYNGTDFILLDPALDKDFLGILGGDLSFGAAANALTITVSPIIVGMRHATASNGTVNPRSASSLSLVLSSGSTMGHGNAVAGPLYHYVIDNAGTLEPACSNKFFGYYGIVSTTAEGGVGAADSGSVMYSATARTNVSFVCIGRSRDTQTTAGLWTATPDLVERAPFARKAPTVQVYATASAHTYTKPWDLLWANIKGKGGGGAGGAAGNSSGSVTSGGGGGEGGYFEKIMLAEAIGPTETFTVGAAAAATSFGAHATANAGGTGGSGTTGAVGGGAGGTATGGDTNITGQVGDNSLGVAGIFVRGGNGGGLGAPGGGLVAGGNAGGGVAAVPGGGGGGGASFDQSGAGGGAGFRGEGSVEERYI